MAYVVMALYSDGRKRDVLVQPRCCAGIVMAYIVMACIVTAYILMAYT